MADDDAHPPVLVDAVVTGIDIPFGDLVGIAFKATCAGLLALLCVVLILGFPAVLIYQGVVK